MDIKQIDLEITQLAGLISEHNKSEEIVSSFIFVFNLMFDNSSETLSVRHEINRLYNQKLSQNTNQIKQLSLEYLARITKLKQLLDLLPDNFLHKDKLIHRLLENCPLSWIEKFEQNKILSLTDTDQFIKSITFDAHEETVELITWGTKEEFGNGLRNILRQKLNGENLGHAALVMRLPVNEKNRKLIEAYCCYENGSLKIPHKIRSYGTKPVYEIYWSYWPERLQTMKQDIEKERSGFEFTTYSNVLNKLPSEVRQRYCAQKQISGFWGSRVINLAPAALSVITPLAYDKQKEDYLNLKIKKYQLQEEIQTLEVLISNYLEKNKIFGTKKGQSWDEKDIQSSNFLYMLARFKNQLPALTVYAKMLKKKKITYSEAQQLLLDAAALIEEKKREESELKLKIREATKNFYIPSIEIKNIRKTIKVLEEELSCHQELKEMDLLVNELKTKEFEDRVIPTRIYEWLKNISEVDDELRRKEILDSHKLKLIQLNFISSCIQSQKEKLTNDSVLQEELKKAKTVLEALYLNPKLETAEIYHERIAEKMRYIQYGIQKLQELDVRIISSENRFKINSFQRRKEFEALEQLILQVNEDDVLHQSIVSADTTINYLQGLLNKNTPLKEQFVYYESKIPKKFNEKMQFGDEEEEWYLENEADIKLLLLRIKQERKQLKARLTQYPISFVYNSHRARTQDEINSYGDSSFNQYDEIWEVNSKQDLERLLEIIQEDVIRDQKNPFCEFDFVYNMLREKTAEEISIYGNNVYTNDMSIIWEIKNKEDAKGLIVIINNEIEQFKQEINGLEAALTEMSLQSTIFPEQLIKQRVIRGIPAQKVNLHSFDIESMLKTASLLATTTFNFKLKKENCSTTCMKILHSGAPDPVKHMFNWTEHTAENPAEHTILTNPQAVHSACKLVSKSQHGDADAQFIIDKEKYSKPYKDYYIKINNLLAFELNKKELWADIYNYLFDYLKILPNLIGDLWVKKDQSKDKNAIEVDTYFNRLNDAIRAQQFTLIKHQNPVIAIQFMMNKLQNDPTALPFFDENTLQVVDNFISDIEAKDSKSVFEMQQLAQYQEIITERDERVDCIERHLKEEKDIGAKLISRSSNAKSLQWDLTREAHAEMLVTTFIKNYTFLRNREYGSFFRTNFIAHFKKDSTFEDKLQDIQQHIKKRPHSRSAKAWKLCQNELGLTLTSLQQNSSDEDRFNQGLKWSLHDSKRYV